MVLDTSAVLAILLAEPDAARYAQQIETAERCSMSSASFLDAAMVIDGRGDAIASRRLDAFVRESEVKILPFTADQAQTARQAFRDFGRGRHKASLNFGDCITYALAKELGEPLLFKGNNFSKTDILNALK
jgi:ribonuclease VapC